MQRRASVAPTAPNCSEEDAHTHRGVRHGTGGRSLPRWQARPAGLTAEHLSTIQAATHSASDANSVTAAAVDPAPC